MKETRLDSWVRKSSLEKEMANPLQDSSLENSLDCELASYSSWVSRSQTGLSDYQTFPHTEQILMFKGLSCINFKE